MDCKEFPTSKAGVAPFEVVMGRVDRHSQVSEHLLIVVHSQVQVDLVISARTEETPGFSRHLQWMLARYVSRFWVLE